MEKAKKIKKKHLDEQNELIVENRKKKLNEETETSFQSIGD